MIGRRPPKGMVDCPACLSDGQVINHRAVRGTSIDPPMTECPICHGRGWVTPEEASEVDPGDWE